MHHNMNTKWFLYKSHEECLIGDNYKFSANARNKDHKIALLHHFVAYYNHLNISNVHLSVDI